MDTYPVKILAIENITHDVKRFRLEKPAGYHFSPGQATDVAIDKNGWTQERRPFTFTSLAEDEFLEFTIKIYEDHNGVTNELAKLSPGDQMIIHEVWGAIEYKGPGYFIAGGAGITPFIAILRQLGKENKLENNKLFFSNKTEKDIILKEELSELLGKNLFNVITDEKSLNFYHGFIDEPFILREVNDLNKKFYICGPPKMVDAIQQILLKLGAKPEAVVFEK